MESEKNYHYTGYNAKLKENARILRKNMTKQEKHLWYDFLRTCPIKWYKQRVIGRYIVDFYCHAAHLIIELDGSQHYTEDGEEYDEIRTEILEQYQLEVLRFPNVEVDRNFEGVCRAIEEKIMSRLNR
ncbi:endonuclease domain-containing protein [uncultured Ruminococcus sp.]|uniref:endonuclease domain-containing protein n=1 Tax=uncultured Ruminococcus sp. TaxID=165186 RepID=UPI002611E4A5|nr:endonuclease domain-containing protein [uncultured Ruminococcus sp.]